MIANEGVFCFNLNNTSYSLQVLYLRQFRSLNSLTLEGCPLTTDPNYRSYVCAFLSELQYLDYQRIRESTALSRLESIHETQTSIMEEILAGYRDEIHELWDQLMANEMVISEQIEEVCTDFGRNIREMVTYFLEGVFCFNLNNTLFFTLYLRQFRSLNSLTLEGCPLTTDPNYRSYVCAFLSELQYLDYQRIRESTRHAAYMQYQMTVDQFNEKMREDLEIEDNCEKRRQEAEYHASAFVDEVEGDSLYESIMHADPECQRFLPLPLVGEIVEQYPFREFRSIVRLAFFDKSNGGQLRPFAIVRDTKVFVT
ncbi:hypothetical protein AHF37_03203 [Paragonimus kellicotti]|nr:hypothetical protein AHF37_03203 [Paragonimus kellicotti]